MPGAYWRFQKPKGDYLRECFINGFSYHPASIPWVTYPQCDSAFATGRTLSFACPDRVLEMLRPLGKGPLPWDQHAALRREVESVLRAEGHDIQIRPGDEFQPLYWEVPSRPRRDFFWAGPYYIIVNQRVKSLFEEHGVRGVEFHPVVLGKVGDLDPYDAIPSEEQLADPVDLFELVPLLEDPESVGEFYEMLIQTDTLDLVPPEPPRPEEDPCSFCGGARNPDLSFMDRPAPADLPAAAVPDVDVFSSRILRSNVVSHKVECIVRGYGLEGCRLTRVRIIG